MKMRHFNAIALSLLLGVGCTQVTMEIEEPVAREASPLADRALITGFENKMIPWMRTLSDAHTLTEGGAYDEAFPLVRKLEQDMQDEPLYAGVTERDLYQRLLRATQEERAMMRALRYGTEEDVKRHHHKSIQEFTKFREGFAAWMEETR